MAKIDFLSQNIFPFVISVHVSLGSVHFSKVEQFFVLVGGNFFLDVKA